MVLIGNETFMDVWGPLLTVVTPLVSAVAAAFGWLWSRVTKLQDRW